jgi:hypothetical protein
MQSVKKPNDISELNYSSVFRVENQPCKMSGHCYLTYIVFLFALFLTKEILRTKLVCFFNLLINLTTFRDIHAMIQRAN